MIALEGTAPADHLAEVLAGRDLGEILAAAPDSSLDQVVEGLVAEVADPGGGAEAVASALGAAVLAAAEEAIRDEEGAAWVLDRRVLGALDPTLQLLAWRQARAGWLATHKVSLDGLYVKSRLAKELPDYEVTSSAYCQSTRREIPPELAAEAARVGGEVRWFAPEGRLVPAVKFPPEFADTEHARWCVRRDRARQRGSHTLRRGADDARWEAFLDDVLGKLRAALEISGSRIREHGASIQLELDVVEGGGP